MVAPATELAVAAGALVGRNSVALAIELAAVAAEVLVNCKVDIRTSFLFPSQFT